MTQSPQSVEEFVEVRMRRYAVFAGLLLAALLMAGCIANYKPATAAQFFRDKLNLDPLPPGISDFRQTDYDADVSGGHFTYRATPSFIAALLKHDKFFEDFRKEPINQQLHQVKCGITYYSSSTWSDQLSVIDMAGKVCYTGIFVPYVHIIVYDPEAQTVDHFYYPIAP